LTDSGWLDTYSPREISFKFGSPSAERRDPVSRKCGQFGFALAALMVCASIALAQSTIQFPRGTTAPAATAPGIISAPAPGAGATTVNPYTGGSFSTAPFDPYSTNGASAYSFWSNTPPSNNTGVFAQPPPSTYGATSPLAPPPGVASPYGPAAAPYAPGQPGYLFPTGVAPGWDYTQATRLIQDLRLRHTWVEGADAPTDLDINDTDVAVTFTWPGFLWGTQPLFISPAFALHLWDGPQGIPADLPSKAYSAYLDFQYATDPTLQIGAELGFRVGVYSDFNTLVTDSLRFQGLALGVARLTPTITLKGGVMYLDRVDVKLLPAGGILWTPTPQIRFDIFFPQPKLAAFLANVGQYEVWWYLAGEYGGGSWTIERAGTGITQQIDINDFRVSAGLEWNGPRGFTGFVEGGWVFNRVVLYRGSPLDNFTPEDTFMVRAGFSW
jgi:hypothetical protein